MSKLLEVVRKLQNKDKELWKQKQDKINLDFVKFLQETFKDGYLHTIDNYNKDRESVTCCTDENDKIKIQLTADLMQNFIKQIIKNVTEKLLVQDIYEPGVAYAVPEETDWPKLVGFMVSKRKESTYYVSVTEIKNNYVNVKIVLNDETALLYIESDLESDSYYSDIPIEINLND